MISDLATIPLWGWLVLVLAALLAGFAKTAIGGVAMLTVVLATLVLPPRASTGVVLLIFLTGDLVAIWIYRRLVDWRLIGRLVLPVLVGLGLGAVFLGLVDDQVLKRTIGAILLGLLLLGLRQGSEASGGRAAVIGYGGLAGFTTMVANAGGPAMSMYLLAARYEKWRFLGTTAWFFFAVNLSKLPISVGLGIVTAPSWILAAILAPVVLLGTWLGRLVVGRLDQVTFDRLVTVFVALSAAWLLVG